MSSVAAKPNAISASRPCAHCGLPSPRPADETKPAFCCSGCRGAYELIRGWGLDEFYGLQTAGDEAQVKEIADNLADLDDPQLMGQSAPRLVTGGEQTVMKTELAITGLHCAACAWLIERVPREVPAWISATINWHRSTVTILFDPTGIKLSEIAGVLARIGYHVSPLIFDQIVQSEARENRGMLVDIAIAAFCAANAMWIAVALYAGGFTGIAASHVWFLRVAGVALGAAAVAIPGRVFFRSALASIRTRTPHMDLPVAIGLAAGLAASVYGLFDPDSDVYFDSIAALVFFLLLGRWIQVRQQRRANRAVAELTRLTPVAANRLGEDGQTSRVPVNQIQTGDLVVSLPGESLPVDGKVIAGCSLLDRSLLTGESRPVEVIAGDSVEAGTENVQSALTIEVTATGESTRIGEIARSISDAAASRTPVVQLANRIGGWFVVVVIGLAVLTCGLWWPSSPAGAIANAVSLLIVACPCALALATPLAIAVTVGRLAKRRVLVRSGECLERLAKPGTVFFDKTGTLTAGRMQVTAWLGADDVLRSAAAIESEIVHPMAKAIVFYAESQSLPATSVATDVRQLMGRGVTGTVDGIKYAIGNESLLATQQQLDDEFAQTVDRIVESGASPIFVLADGFLVGVLGVSDPIRRSARPVIRQLQTSGWDVQILSGDHQATTKQVGEQLGIAAERIHAGLLPAEKLAAIKSAHAEGPVVMVGDGVNDAAALAAADVGVAVRGGAAASLAAAPVMIGGDQLDGVLVLLDASRRTRNTIIRNFAVSLTYNAFAVTLAMAGYITPLLAAALMPASSISVLAMTLSSKTPQGLSTA